MYIRTLRELRVLRGDPINVIVPDSPTRKHEERSNEKWNFLGPWAFRTILLTGSFVRSRLFRCNIGIRSRDSGTFGYQPNTIVGNI